MTCTNQQVKELMRTIKIRTQKISAMKAGMNVKTARRYLKAGRLPSELKKPHDWQTREDVFSEVWDEIEIFIKNSSGIQAKTIFNYLQNKYPGRFEEGQLRTLQRRFQDWRALNGKNDKVIFCQNHLPGVQSQSDYTEMNSLNITIAGTHFKHLLFHFMLTYSRWETVSIAYEESFASLAEGYEKAVWDLGAVAIEHRTDNLTAATKKVGGSREFTVRWRNVMKHYGVTPTRNNPGVSNENGSVEKSHDLFKTAIDQQLMLRGNRDFLNLDEYLEFLQKVKKTRNDSRKIALIEEMQKLKTLPMDKWSAPKIMPVRVSSSSTVQVDKAAYSVPSRLISYTLMAHIYYDKIRLYYGQKCLQEMPKEKNNVIDYRHIIDGLVRKPGAFNNYQYKEALFPKLCFRKAYDTLIGHHPSLGNKYYLTILQLAKMHGEHLVATGLELLMEQKIVPLPEEVKGLLDLPVKIPNVKIREPKTENYNQLLSGRSVK